MTDTPRRTLDITDNRASESGRRARDFADKRAVFPPDIERQDGKTYRFRV